MRGHCCKRCTRPQSDTAIICHQCTREIHKALTGIADLWPHLEESIGRQTTMGPQTGGKPTKRDAQPLPLNLHASHVASRTKATLVGWVRVLADDHHLTLPADNVPALCAWLDHNRHHLRLHEAATEAVNELVDASGAVTRAVDYPDDKSKIYVGACIAHDEDGDPCPGEIHAIIPERNGGSPRMECRECGSQWDATQWTRLGVLIRRRAEQINLQKSYGKATS